MRAGRRRRRAGSKDAATDQTALPNLGGLPPTSDSFQHTRMTYYTEKHARVDEGWRGRSVGPTVDFTVVRTPLRTCFPPPLVRDLLPGFALPPCGNCVNCKRFLLLSLSASLYGLCRHPNGRLCDAISFKLHKVGWGTRFPSATLRCRI